MTEQQVDRPPSRGVSTDTRWLYGLGAVAAVSLLFSLTLGTVNRSGDYADGSPERVVGEYIDAVLEGDEQGAVALLAGQDELDVNLRSCREERRFAAPEFRRPFEGDDVRVTVLRTTEAGLTADVSIITRVNGSDVFSDGYDSETVIGLRRTTADSPWRVSRANWPYLVCR